MAIESRLGEGTAVTVRLPVMLTVAEAAVGPPKARLTDACQSADLYLA